MKGKSTFFLGLFTLCFGAEIIYFLFGTSQINYLYPQYSGFFYFLIGFLYGPLLYWHFRYNFDKKEKFNPWQFLHLLPILLEAVYLKDVLLMPGVERIRFMKEHFLDFVMPLNYIRAVHLLIYGLILILFLVKKNQIMDARLKLYKWSIAAIYFVSCVAISWFTLFANSWRDFDLYYIIACNIGVVIAILLYTDPDFLKEIRRKYLSSGISKDDKKRIAKKIQVAFATDKLFLRNDLNLAMLETEVGEKSHSISQTFTEEINESFQTFLNRHRIEYAKSLLKEKEKEKFTIEAIGQMAGFNNKVSFYKAFRQFTSQTPSEYRKGLK